MLAVLFLASLVGHLPSAHAAGPPEAMAYQGFLVDANGNPLAPSTPANYPVIFKIYAAPSGGASLWSEQQIVTVDKGNFSVILSEGTAVGGEPRPPLSTVLSTNGADRYIELSVTIGTAPPAPMLPRLRLLPMAYAFLATSANNLVSPSGVPVIRYGNSRVEVTGDIAASGVISGNGAGLTGLTVGQVSGTFADNQLSANVARRDVANAFTGNQSINGTLGVGTTAGVFPLTIGNNSLGDKISLWGQSGDSFGFGIQGGLFQIHSANAGSDIAFGYGSSAAMTETMRIKGNGNAGIGTPSPNARLSVVAPGASELGGSALSTTLRTTAGTLGTGAGSELALASIGFNSGNNSSLGIRGYRAANGADWTTTSIGLEMDVDNSPRLGGGGASLWLHANGNMGVGTAVPTAKLEVAGAIKANGITVNGTVSATTFSGTFNGEKPPQTYTVGPGANLNTWRELSMDTAALLGDTDGGRIKVLLRDHSSRQVRTSTYEFYAENDADNFGQAWRAFITVSSFGTQRYFRLGTTDAGDIATDYNWIYIRNYRSGLAFGGNDFPPENFANRYRFWILVPPNITATVIVYDR